LFAGEHFDVNCINFHSMCLQITHEGNPLFNEVSKKNHSLQHINRTSADHLTGKCVLKKLGSLKLHGWKPDF
jgi:hypothetical protein